MRRAFTRPDPLGIKRLRARIAPRARSLAQPEPVDLRAGFRLVAGGRERIGARSMRSGLFWRVEREILCADNGLGVAFHLFHFPSMKVVTHALVWVHACALRAREGWNNWNACI